MTWSKAIGQSQTGAITVDEGVAFNLTFIGDKDSKGFHKIDSDGVLLAVGSDSDDSDASDATINTDTTLNGDQVGTDTDGLLISDNFSDTTKSYFGMGGLIQAINTSPNWRASLVAALPGSRFDNVGVLLTKAGSDAIDSGQTVLVEFDTSATDNFIGADPATADTDRIARQFCIGREFDSDLGSDNYIGLARVSKANLPLFSQPKDSDISTTNTDVGPAYNADVQAKATKIVMTGETPDSDTTGTLDVYCFAAKQSTGAVQGKSRLIFKHTVTTDTSNLKEIDLKEADLASVVTLPGERLVVILSPSDTANTTFTGTVHGKYGSGLD